MRFSRPSTGTILGAIALFIALGGTALAATATVVNIADPTTPAHVAHVDASGRLEVGDGSGPLTVDGTVTTQQATPANYVHVATLGLTSGRGCVEIAAPPTNRAMIVTDVKIDVFSDPSPGPDQYVRVFSDPSCQTAVADVNPSGVGQTLVPFEPGVGIAAGSQLSAIVSGSVEAEAYTDGYAVAQSVVPARPQARGRTQRPQQ